ncbi:MAG TPA: D-arabinono-1,4-lactone oxidase [Edaphobacter sp.]|nr:D-arabinono-1,4-lactone oxidase [Edaphobacter sp.]
MDKREFLKTSGALLASTLFPKLTPAQATGETRINWAGNYTYSTKNLDVAKTVEDVRQNVRSQSHLKALGARHSFNGIADSTVEQISLKPFDQIELDAEAKTVTVGAGVTYGQLAPYIDSRGFAVHNLASLPHISVVGACATATHGSGSKNGNLSTAVRAMEIVTANGDVVTFSRERLGDKFPGTVVGLGALGVITRITLDVRPTFKIAQTVYEDLPFSQLETHLDDIFASGYSVSIFTDWQKHRATQVWVKRRVNPGRLRDPYFYGAKPATQNLHPLAGHSAENCTEQMGIPGPWYERLPHFKMNFTPSSGAELQSEYFVPRDKGYAAILAVEELRDQITPHLFITELRTVAADDLWISPCYQRPSMTIHFTWKPEWPEVKKVLPLIEEKLAPFGGRPHWAKLFTMQPASLRAQYAKMRDYQALLAQYDPTGKFRNEFINTNIYGA